MKVKDGRKEAVYLVGPTGAVQLADPYVATVRYTLCTNGYEYLWCGCRAYGQAYTCQHVDAVKAHLHGEEGARA